jgi:hypothetical protein
MNPTETLFHAVCDPIAAQKWNHSLAENSPDVARSLGLLGYFRTKRLAIAIKQLSANGRRLEPLLHGQEPSDGRPLWKHHLAKVAIGWVE